MLNMCVLEGYIASEVTFTSKDTVQYSYFTLAVPRDYKDSEGNNPADFIRCVVFGTSAENLALKFTKGKRITVWGRAESSNFKDSEGKTQYRTVLNVSRWYFGERKPKTLEECATYFQ